LMRDERFHGERVCSAAQLRTPLLLKNLEGRGGLISIELRRLAAHDREKNTQYCETLYYYLICCRSLKKTCDALYTHRNTVLYRIRRLQEDFDIPLDDPSLHADLLLGVSLILFETKGPDFFLHTQKNEA
ncbi:helix-turn-helix domain-containing protein, partial [Dysosmobacter sp.]